MIQKLDPTYDRDFIQLVSGTDVSISGIERDTRDSVESVLATIAEDGLQGIRDEDNVQLAKVTPSGVVQITIHNKVHELTLDTNDPAQAALLYVRRGYLGVEDRIPDCFFDGGRGMRYEIDDQENIIPRSGSSTREILIVDQNNDELLQEKMSRVQSALEQLTSEKGRVLELAQRVSLIFGGNNEPQLEQMSDQEIADLMSVDDLKAVYIGDISFGVCRHRSILFKYIADRSGIQSSLVRGYHDDIPHIWNQVVIGEKEYIIDASLNPSTLLPLDHPEAQKYRWENGYKK